MPFGHETTTLDFFISPFRHPTLGIVHLPVNILLTVLHFLLQKVAPQSHWRDRLTALFAKYPAIPLHFMGFPSNWTESPLWMTASDDGRNK